MMNAKLDALGLGWVGSTVSIAFLAILFALIALVVWRLKRKDYLGGGLAFIVLTAVGYSPAKEVLAYLDFKNRYDTGKALFEEKCKTAGERIYRTVDNVEGILLLKMREESRGDGFYRNFNDPLWPDAALAKEYKGNLYIQSFLVDRKEIVVGGYRPNEIIGRRIVGEVGSAGAERGFRYVDVVDSTDGQRYRVTAVATQRPGFQPEIALQRQATDAEIPRYAVTFENNVDPALRKYWVAGTTVKVIDTKTNEILGEMSVWKFDRSQGATNQSMPWATSVSECPEPNFGQYGMQTHYFVEQVLKARQGR